VTADVRGRVPPHDLDAEAAVLSALLNDGAALDAVADILRPEHFYSKANARIFEAVLALSAVGTRGDIVTVAGWLRAREQLARVGGAEYLARIADATPHVAHVADHARVVRERWRVRRMIAECQRIAAEGYGDVGDVDEWIGRAEGTVFALAGDKAAGSGAYVREVVREAFSDLEKLHASGTGMLGLSTGLRDLDGALGGLCPGELVVVAGRPGMGKSALATGFAEAVARSGRGVALFSLEMPRAQLGLRMACGVARVDSALARRNRLTPDDWSALTTASQDLARLPVWIDDTAAVRPLDVRARVRRFAAETARAGSPIGLVVVDYLQLMNGRDGLAKGSNREQEIAHLSRSLKALAKEANVCVVALSQLNRGVETRPDKRPSMSDLRESGAIEQDADAIVMVYRHEYYSPDDDAAAGVAELILAKARSGQPGTVLAHFDGPTTTFRDLANGDAYREAVLAARKKR